MLGSGSSSPCREAPIHRCSERIKDSESSQRNFPRHRCRCLAPNRSAFDSYSNPVAFQRCHVSGPVSVPSEKMFHFCCNILHSCTELMLWALTRLRRGLSAVRNRAHHKQAFLSHRSDKRRRSEVRYPPVTYPRAGKYTPWLHSLRILSCIEKRRGPPYFLAATPFALPPTEPHPFPVVAPASSPGAVFPSQLFRLFL